MIKGKTIDRRLLFIVLILVVVGYIIFSSASLGRLAREESLYASLAFKQAIIGIVGGGLAMLTLANIPYKYLRRFALPLLLGGIGINLLIFIPGLSQSYGGASRWLSIGGFSFQPSEILKLVAVIYYAAWLSGRIKDIQTFENGFIPLALISGLIEGLLLLQHDTDPIIILAFIGMFFISGGKWRHIGLLMLVGLVGLAGLAFYRPYIQQRILSFVDPSRDAQGSSYQLQQALIAVGTGGFFGRGYGQSIQKFNYLPEAIGDSIFAVEAEEFGFAGSVILITLFLLFALQALKIASNTTDVFGSNLVIGFVIIMIGQSFMNIGAMLGILPLTGVPLLFVSQGGTSMLVGLAEVGIILSVSRFKK